ncbi:uncharacterized protein KIAA0513 [Exaiptasia diaphana]|uniref:SBF1/SBF2 domain-containing protein n=1 Tax=Exaiptasia diaphana TaxID=2652724 RepID=A0A913Y5V0_EXADI|nr:uncharacterized protein KIAA0513 [Exaiptasia diaphana]KXJ22126.1 Uncharacterized protein KIAA0513 [Exaiptasia diaphana]
MDSPMSSDQEQDFLDEDEDEEDLFEKECDIFIHDFVIKIFSGSEITQEDKAKFGVVCQHSCGRQAFAKHIDAQRVYSKSVDEMTFYRLIQYFAVVLFECHQADDFVPAKNLMNMCFTFYHEFNPGDEVDTPKKEFLTAYLSSQPIWQSMRYWNAAFFDAVHSERGSPAISSKEWESWSSQEQLDYQECDKNSLFGKLGTFVSNMKAFGLSKDMCSEFLHKMSTIGDLEEDHVTMLEKSLESELECVPIRSFSRASLLSPPVTP